MLTLCASCSFAVIASTRIVHDLKNAMEARFLSGVPVSSNGGSKSGDGPTKRRARLANALRRGISSQPSPSAGGDANSKNPQGDLESYRIGARSFGNTATVNAVKERSTEKIDLDLDMLNPLAFRTRTGHGPNGMISADVYCGVPAEGSKSTTKLSNVASDAHARADMPTLERGQARGLSIAQEHEMDDMDLEKRGGAAGLATMHENAGIPTADSGIYGDLAYSASGGDHTTMRSEGDGVYEGKEGYSPSI